MVAYHPEEVHLDQRDHAEEKQPDRRLLQISPGDDRTYLIGVEDKELRNVTKSCEQLEESCGLRHDQGDVK